MKFICALLVAIAIYTTNGDQARQAGEMDDVVQAEQPPEQLPKDRDTTPDGQHLMKMEQKQRQEELASSNKTGCNCCETEQLSLKEFISSSLNTLKQSFQNCLGCPEGFFVFSGQCFKLFTDKGRTWEESKAKCEDEGLVMAKPNEPVALRAYIVKTYGASRGNYKYAWVGARGTDKGEMVWIRDGTIMNKSDPLWLPKDKLGVFLDKKYCLQLIGHDIWLKSLPTRPYSNGYCHYKGPQIALCEYV